MIYDFASKDEDTRITQINMHGRPVLNVGKVIEQYSDVCYTEPKSGKTYVFDGVAYREVPIYEMESEIFARARAEGVSVISLATWREIEKNVGLANFTSGLEKTPPNIACFLDGVVDLNAEELEITDHGDPRYFTTEKLNIHSSDVLKYLQHPEDIPEGALHLFEMMPQEDDYKVLMECIGCFLFDRARQFAPILYVYGEGGSGKTHIGNVLYKLLGERASPNGLPQRETSNFNLSYAFKNLILVDEVKGGTLSDFAFNELKKLTSATPYHINPKGRDGFIVQANEKPMVYMTSNDRPNFKLDSGVDRRFRVIRTAGGKIDDTTYKAWCTDEFAAWMTKEALLAYRRVCKRKEIIRNTATISIAKGASNSVVSFWMEEVEGLQTREDVRSWLLSTPTQISPRVMLQKIHDFESEYFTRDGMNYQITARTLPGELDRLYGLEWEKSTKKYRDLDSRDSYSKDDTEGVNYRNAVSVTHART